MSLAQRIMYRTVLATIGELKKDWPARRSILASWARSQRAFIRACL